MTTRELRAAHRAMWALGDYHKFATSTVWELGPVLVDACRISRGQRVLDVAAGTGVEWIEGDAEALPFEHDEFDVVTSCFGAMFAQDHKKVTDELLRVCGQAAHWG